jgi:hypothetical protein
LHVAVACCMLHVACCCCMSSLIAGESPPTGNHATLAYELLKANLPHHHQPLRPLCPTAHSPLFFLLKGHHHYYLPLRCHCPSLNLMSLCSSPLTTSVGSKVTQGLGWLGGYIHKICRLAQDSSK